MIFIASYQESTEGMGVKVSKISLYTTIKRVGSEIDGLITIPAGGQEWALEVGSRCGGGQSKCCD